MTHRCQKYLIACLLLPCLPGATAFAESCKVTSVDVRVNPLEYRGKGPAHFRWTGEIRVSPHKEAVTVQYHWARSDKASMAEAEIVLKPGVMSYQVHDDWELGPSGGKTKDHVWEQLCVKAPSGKNSRLAVANFEWAK
jgi:hypothetical protein